MSERILVEFENHVAKVTLNRAAKRNAADAALLQGLITAGQRLAKEKSLRAVLLQGAGEHFCAGIDVSIFSGQESIEVQRERMQPQPDTTANFYQHAVLVWRDMPVPVVAALDGCTFGAGFQLAMAADIRIGGNALRMSIMEVNWGVIPDMGLTVTLPGVVADDKLRELAYTGRIVEAEEAHALGLVTQLNDDPKSAALRLTSDIAAKSPDAIRSMKRLFNEAPEETRGARLRLEADLQWSVMSGDNHREAALANTEKRHARFSDPD